MDRRAYDPKLPPYPDAPQKQTYAAFSPGMLDAMSRQLAAGYGPSQEAQKAALQGTYQDTTTPYLPQPIMGVIDAIKTGKYQQYGQDTGSPFLNSLLGFTSEVPAPGSGATGQFDPAAMAAAAAAEAERLRKQREAEEAARRAAMSGQQTTNDFQDRYGRGATF
jgi:hypothetical protein